MARNNTNRSTLPAVNTATLDPIFGDTNFFTFWQQIEGTPHNTVHSFVGQTMGGFTSASDPLFWMHHCMVDYCWAKWNIELGNDNTNDMTWIEHVNSHFVDENGNAASATAGITILMPLLSYRYESSAIGSSPAEAALMTKAEYQKVEARLRAGAKIAFDIKQRIVITEKAAVRMARPFSATTKAAPQDFARIINTDTAQERIFASIAFAQLPATSDFYLRVFLNLPSASNTTPTTDPHYAGTFAFFGTDIPGAQHKLEPSFLVNLTNTIQRLKGAQELRDGTPLSVQLVAVPFSGKFERPDTELVLNQIEIITTPVIIRSKQ
jgi:tyrosinase